MFFDTFIIWMLIDQSINVGIIFFFQWDVFAHFQFSRIFHKNIFLSLEAWSNYMVHVHSCWQKLVLSDTHIQNPWRRRRPLWVHAFVGAFRGVFHLFFLFVPGKLRLIFSASESKGSTDQFFLFYLKDKREKKKGVEQKGLPHFEHC
jgi:hypothetical protein